MPPDEDRNDHSYLWDMRQALRDLADITSDRTAQDLQSDRQLQLAVERAIEIIGEAARKVSQQTREAHPDVEWNGIIAQRHVIAHEYGGIQYDKLWRIVDRHAPKLAGQLDAILPPPPPDPLPEDKP